MSSLAVFWDVQLLQLQAFWAAVVQCAAGENFISPFPSLYFLPGFTLLFLDHLFLLAPTRPLPTIWQGPREYREVGRRQTCLAIPSN